MPIAAPDYYSNPSGSTIYAGRLSGVQPPAPPPGTVLSTLTMVNETAGAQPAGLVSPMFGVPVKQGEIPAGDNPQFKLTDGTDCPATIWGKTSWPDGSLKFCAAMVRLPASVAAGGALVVEVQNGGVMPAPSLRSVSDLTAADIKVELTGVTNLSGLWTASLNDAITEATDVTVIGTGAVGKVWRIGGDCKQAGAAHGQLYCWHYVAALTNDSGGLLGLRYLGRVAQPWAEINSPVATRRTVTAQLKLGSTVRRTFQGHDTDETPGANIGMDHYTSWFTADTNARWDYIQSAGSAAIDGVVRVKHNKNQQVRTKLLPPFNLALIPAANTSSPYNPYCAAQVTRGMGNTGERPDIGLFTSWAVRHLMLQSEVDETLIRVQGLASGGWRTGARYKSTKQIVPVMETAPSYAGLGTIQPNWRCHPDYMVGFVLPATSASLWQREDEPSHRPGLAYYPYLVTGEPQYLDLLIEQAGNFITNKIIGKSFPNVTQPVTDATPFATAEFGERDVVIGSTMYKGGGMLFYEGLTRIVAWCHRDIAQAAAIYPDACPNGTEVRKYLRDVLKVGYDAMNDYNSRFGADWSNMGLIYFNKNAPEYLSVWCSGFLSNAVCHAASILPSSGANTFRQFLGRFWENMASQMDIAAAYSHHASPFDSNGVRFSKMDDLMFEVVANLSFSTSTNRITVILGQSSAWSPHDGDVFCFAVKAGANPIPTYPYRTKFYAVNCSGKSAQLSLTPGGAPIALPLDIASYTGPFVRLSNFAPDTTFEGYPGAGNHMDGVNAAIQHHAACGDNMSIASPASAEHITRAGTVFTSNPKNAMASAYPA